MAGPGIRGVRRGGAGARVIEELSISGLGVIGEARLPLGPGFTAVTGETGAGKTMVVTALALLLGERADAGSVRAGSAQAGVEGRWLVAEDGEVAERVREAGGDLDALGDGRAELILARTVSAEGRSRGVVGGRSTPVGVLAELGERLVVVHGQSDQLRLRSAAAQRDALDALVATQNPLLTTSSTAQCIACHTSTYLGVHRAQVAVIGLGTLPSRFQSTHDVRLEDGISATTPASLHAFGWLGGDIAISQRVVNETAMVLDEIQQRFPVP